MKEKGVVKIYFANKSYGFIEMENGRDVFFHVKQLFGGKTDRIPKVGDPVVFKKVSNKKGSSAEPWAFADEVTAVEMATKPEVVSVEPPKKKEFRSPDKLPTKGIKKEKQRRQGGLILP